MGDRLTYQGEPGESNQPLCAMWDAVSMGQSASLGIGVTRTGALMECTGMRRYRLKYLQVTGTGPSRIRAMDLPFAPNSANAWEIVVLAAAQAAATRVVFNMGEGTANLVNFMGPYLAIELQNNGPDAATYELELWTQC